ncbi:MAG: VTT domain-containing protein [Pseudomonadota bacterium]
MLILGGLAFGVAGGIVWGTLGLLASALVLLTLGRMLGTEWVEQRFGSQALRMLERVERMGLIVVFASTAHPLGPLTPVHLAAGIACLGTPGFAAAIAAACLIRSAPYAFLGTAILDMTVAQSLAIAAALAALLVVPLLYSRVRGWVLGTSIPLTKDPSP